MKRFLLFLLLWFLLIPGITLAQGMQPVGGVTVAAAGSSGTWYYATTNEPDEKVLDLTNYYFGARVTTPGSSYNVTAAAFKVAAVGNATSCCVGIYSNETTSTLLASGSCTPASGAWCVANITYAAAANTTYKVMHMCNGDTLSTYGKDSVSGGCYADDYYVNCPTGSKAFTDAENSSSAALCTGGTCGAAR